MRLEQLEYLMKVGTYQNMTKAADALHISQPALSESIKRLEKELDIVLLERAYNGVSLTSAGVLVVEAAEQIFQQMHTLEEKLALLRQTIPSGLLCVRMEVTPFFGNTYLFQYLQACQEATSLQIQAEIRDAREIIDKLADKQLRAGIVLMEEAMAQKIQQQYPQVSFLLLRTGHLQVVLQETHPLAQYEEIPVTEFLKYPFLFPKNGCIPALELLKSHGSTDKYMESSIYTLPMNFIQKEQGSCLISSVLLEYFDSSPFGMEGLLVKDLNITIPVHLYIAMENQFAHLKSGQQMLEFTEQYFKNSVC